LLKNIKRFSGTSIGALFATLLSIGYTADEIMYFSDLIDTTVTSNCFVTKVYNVCNKFGVSSMDNLKREFERIIDKKVRSEITLEKLYKITGKDLVICVTNLNTKSPVYFHHKTYPEAKLIDVIIASMSFPMLFRPCKLPYLGTNDYFVDGGLVDNYPVWVFNDLEKLNNGKISEIEKDSKVPSTTLGIKIIDVDDGVFDGRSNIQNVGTYITEIINTFMLQKERSYITSSYISQTVPIYVPNISFIDFDMTNEKIDKLIEIGKQSIINYLKYIHQ
jgi:NTE family protein